MGIDHLSWSNISSLFPYLLDVYLINTMYSLSNELILGVFPVVLYITIGNRRITSILSLHVFKEISTACKDLPKTLNKPSEPRSAAADQTTRHLGVAPSTTGREPLLLESLQEEQWLQRILFHRISFSSMLKNWTYLIVPEGRSPESRIISNGICPAHLFETKR